MRFPYVYVVEILWYNIKKELSAMSSQKSNRRLTAVKLADAVNNVEGVPVSRRARQLSVRWVRGEISGAEMKEALIAAHKQSSSDTRNA